MAAVRVAGVPREVSTVRAATASVIATPVRSQTRVRVRAMRVLSEGVLKDLGARAMQPAWQATVNRIAEKGLINLPINTFRDHALPDRGGSAERAVPPVRREPGRQDPSIRCVARSGLN
ncbi:hypothetical protein GCM10023196_097100 [Actinoallomurus vinaceus]|uniref:Uncharacterized protein n=1 Tax=Actinoallomurus vinaceus TaxID=1080074 RepID=A0ABP8USU0_9ACTN